MVNKVLGKSSIIQISDDEVLVNDLDYINEVMEKGDDKWSQQDLRAYIDMINGVLPEDKHKETIKHLYDRACIITGKLKQVDDGESEYCDEICEKLLNTKYCKGNKFLIDIRKKISEGAELSKKQYAAVIKLYEETRLLPMYKGL